MPLYMYLDKLWPWMDNEIFYPTDDQYYEYDDINDQVKENGTKYISDRFGPKAGGTESVPNNLDAVLFDPRDNHLYFFKDEWVGLWLF